MNLVQKNDNIRNYFENERILSIVTHRIQKLRNDSSISDAALNPLLETYFKFISSYFNIYPYIYFKEMKEFVPDMLGAFCESKIHSENFDEMLMEFMIAITQQIDGDEIIDCVKLHKDIMFSKLVGFLLVENLNLVSNSIKLIANLTGMNDDWFVNAFKNTPLIPNSLKLLNEIEFINISDVFIYLSNISISGGDLFEDLMDNRELLYNIVRIFQTSKNYEDNALSFINNFFKNSHSPLIQRYVADNIEIVDVITEKISNDKNRNYLIKICHCLQSLLSIGSEMNKMAITPTNIVKERIMGNRSTADKLENIQNHHDKMVASSFINLILDHLDYEDEINQ
jgi:hypothetical protein